MSDPTMLSDRQAMTDAVSAADRLDELVRRYARVVHAVVREVGGPRAVQLGDDVEQRVFLAIWKLLEREQEIRHPSSYIYSAAVRETVRMLRREQRHAGGSEEVEAAPTDARADPAELHESREKATIVAEVIASLAPERQTAVNAHLAGFKVQEIMNLHGWSYHRARNLIARGMAELRRGLGRRGVHV